jgi:hypothetical protein
VNRCSDIWEGLDENLVLYEDFRETAPYESERFIYLCCDRGGDEKGCKETRHKTKANTPSLC